MAEWKVAVGSNEYSLEAYEDPDRSAAYLEAAEDYDEDDPPTVYTVEVKFSGKEPLPSDAIPVAKAIVDWWDERESHRRFEVDPIDALGVELDGFNTAMKRKFLTAFKKLGRSFNDNIGLFRKVERVGSRIIIGEEWEE